MKRIFEEICSHRPEGKTLGWCGDLAVTQCAECSAFLCYDHAHTCNVCREQCDHYEYCSGCLNKHRHGVAA